MLTALKNPTVLAAPNIKPLHPFSNCNKIKTCENKNKIINKYNASSVSERSEAVSDILQLYCSQQNHPGEYPLTPVKALDESLQGFSTNLDSYSTMYPLPFPWVLPGLHQVCTPLSGPISGIREQPPPRPSWHMEGRGKEGTLHHWEYMQHTLFCPLSGGLLEEWPCLSPPLPFLSVVFLASGDSSKCVYSEWESLLSESIVNSL